MRFFLISFFVFLLFCGGVYAAERSALEAQLLELENQISQYEGTVSVYQKQGKDLQSEIKRLDGKVGKLNLQIKTVELTLKQLDQDIAENGLRVVATEDELAIATSGLRSALQRLYEGSSTSLVELLLRHPTFSDFFNQLQSLLLLQDQLRVNAERIDGLRDKLVDDREALQTKRADAVALRKYHDAQKASVEQTKGEKQHILTVTKGVEATYQALLKETKKNAAQIRSQIFEFLGGGELSFGEAYQFAKVAESATGVRAALILAVLDRESALGQNVGRCSYKTAMHPTRDIPIFLALVGALAINPDTITVSCANRDGAYGGAMGPAQFIPSTWKLYAARIADITGNNPASPWRNGDAFVGTGLYLKDSGVTKNSTLAEERKAAARYYAGSRWSRYLWTYGDRVVTRAQQFQSDIEVLNG